MSHPCARCGRPVRADWKELCYRCWIMPEKDESSNAEPEPEAQSSAEAPDMGAQIRATLSEMVKSGELVGGEDSESEGDDHRASGSPRASSPSLDLDAAIERAFKRREDASHADDERKAIDQRVSRLENPPKKRRWGSPWSPFGS